MLTVCDSAEESRPIFFGKAMRLHHSFNDTVTVEGPEEERVGAFRKVRDELRSYLKGFPKERLMALYPFSYLPVIGVAFAYYFPSGLALNGVKRPFVSNDGMLTLAVGKSR